MGQSGCRQDQTLLGFRTSVQKRSFLFSFMLINHPSSFLTFTPFWKAVSADTTQAEEKFN